MGVGVERVRKGGSWRADMIFTDDLLRYTYPPERKREESVLVLIVTHPVPVQ